MKLKAITLVALCIGGALLGCGKSSTPTAASSNIVTIPAVVYSWINDQQGYLRLSADPTPSATTSDVMLSWGTDTIIFPYKSQDFGCISFWWLADSSWYGHWFGDTLLAVTLHSNYGDCSGSTQIPAWPDIVTPRDYDTMMIGAVPCAWRKTPRADWYTLSVDIWYPADSISWYYLNSLSVLTFDTTFTIPGSYFVNPGMSSYMVEIYLYAYKGPAPIPGSISNMGGSIKGYLVSESEVGWHDFFVGKPPTKNLRKSSTHRRPNIEERIRNYIVKIR